MRSILQIPLNYLNIEEAIHRHYSLYIDLYNHKINVSRANNKNANSHDFRIDLEKLFNYSVLIETKESLEYHIELFVKKYKER